MAETCLWGAHMRPAAAGANWHRHRRAGTLDAMPKKYLVAALSLLAASVAAGVGVLVLRRTRQEPPPVSPTVPRVEEVSRALAELTESRPS